jgi:hypothetical protein
MDFDIEMFRPEELDYCLNLMSISMVFMMVDAEGILMRTGKASSLKGVSFREFRPK